MTSYVERSGYGARRLSPAAVGATVAVHGAIVAAVLLMPGVTVAVSEVWESLPAKNIPSALPPPPEDPAPATPQPEIRPASTTVDPVIPLKPIAEDFGLRKPDLPPPGTGLDGGGTGGTGAIVDPPIPAPVFVGARVDPRYADAFQPAYPPAKIRLEEEGSVTVRVRIDADGRVAAIDLLSASDDAFWVATRAQALAKWRFVPATRDGMAVASERVMTVRFRLNDL
jgi:protein TonB